MFFEVFCASALATIVFGGKDNVVQKDYSHEFGRINDRLNNVDSKLEKISDDTKFLRARECLNEFSPKLLGEPKLSYKCYTVEDIQKAAYEGFEMLLETAMADEDNFSAARKKFNETYGNIEWVKEKFTTQIENFIIFKKQMDSDIEYLNETGRRFQDEYLSLIKQIDNEEPALNAWFYERKMKKHAEKWLPVLAEFYKKYELPEKYTSNEFAVEYYNYTGRRFIVSDYFGRNAIRDYYGHRYFWKIGFSERPELFDRLIFEFINIMLKNNKKTQELP